jgi:hypothetical protein
MKPEARLENWAVVVWPSHSPYSAPETLPSRLTGNVYEHDHLGNPLPDGLWVTTSPVVCADYQGKIAETCNTIYRLGSPDPKWAEWLRTQEPWRFRDPVLA